MARSALLPICILSLNTLLLDGNQRVSTFLNHGWPEVAHVSSFNYAINFSLISHSCSAIICCNFGKFLHDLHLSTRLCNTPMLKHLPFNFYQLNLMNFLLFTVIVFNKIVMVNLTIRWLMIKMLLSGLCNHAHSYCGIYQ